MSVYEEVSVCEGTSACLCRRLGSTEWSFGVPQLGLILGNPVEKCANSAANLNLVAHRVASVAARYVVAW
jgi:hypothetical protein